MNYIPIVRMGRVINYARVDDDVYHRQAGYRWGIQTRGKGGKPQITRYTKVNGKTRNIFLAREIMNVHEPWRQVYPIDGDPYNLQRDNLGIAGVKRRIQHRATARKLGGKANPTPALGISPIVKMAGAIESYLGRKGEGYGG